MKAISSSWFVVVWHALLMSSLAACADAQSRFADVRMATGRHGDTPFVHRGAFDEVKGTFATDSQARRLRFETAGASPFDVSFDDLIAIHTEESRYPKKRWLWRMSRYLVVHYQGRTGNPRFDVFRLPDDTADALLAAVEHDTGLAIERRPATTSFLGLPIHVGLGDTVVVTDNRHVTVKGPLTELSSATLGVGPTHRFDAASIQQIRIADPIWDGAAAGATVGLLGGVLVMFACANSGNDCYTLVALAGAGIGAAIGAGIDYGTMRPAFRRIDPPGAAGVAIGAVARDRHLALRVAIRF